ncbi:MAG: 6-phosphogluconolactonase [Candidatus Eremiobacteraeota bacterium]|nr:6-phosphogluconolactonase [Candidatus Eremiobacteraeota bacterium]MBV8375230.1 6-phosphogluconolactonase [Candidatus Eremiobacteraeota bacterium]
MIAHGERQIYPNGETLAAAVADLFVGVGGMAIADRGAFRVALSGGNTPRSAYELLGKEPRSLSLSWSDVFIYFGDERCVPPDDEQSNYRMAKKAFLDAVALPPANVHRIRGEADPGIAANEYASILRSDLAQPPRFDLVLLGLGPDGHTASLFPGKPPDTDDNALVRAVFADSQMMWRVTITPLIINLARVVAFAVEGVEKADILAKVLEGPYDPTTYPAQIVAPKQGRLVWLIDELAAGMLHQRA